MHSSRSLQTFPLLDRVRPGSWCFWRLVEPEPRFRTLPLAILAAVRGARCGLGCRRRRSGENSSASGASAATCRAQRASYKASTKCSRDMRSCRDTAEVSARLVQGVHEEDQPARLVSLPHVEPRYTVEVHLPSGDLGPSRAISGDLSGDLSGNLGTPRPTVRTADARYGEIRRDLGRSHRPHGRREGEEVGRATHRLAGPGLAQLREFKPRGLSGRGPRHPGCRPTQPRAAAAAARRPTRASRTTHAAALARRSAMVEPSARMRSANTLPPSAAPQASAEGGAGAPFGGQGRQGAVVRGGGEGEV